MSHPKEPPRRYSIDTSSLILGWYEVYPPDVAPGFWEFMDELVTGGIVVASEEVLVELEKQDGDTLLGWAKARRSMFVRHEADVQEATRRVLKQNQPLLGVKGGRSGADPFVIGVALARGYTVVTEEERSHSPTTKPKIPDACASVSVPCIKLLELIRREGLKLRR